jgi:hypothetical protein
VIHKTVVYGGENGLTDEHLEKMISGELSWEEAHKIAPGDDLFIEVLDEEKEEEEEFLVGDHSYDYETIVWATAEDTWHRLKGPLGTDVAEQMRAREWAASQPQRKPYGGSNG